MIDFSEQEPNPPIEIVLLDRDHKGIPTGKKNSFSSNSGSEIYDFYEKHCAMLEAKTRNKKRKKNKKAKVKND